MVRALVVSLTLGFFISPLDAAPPRGCVASLPLGSLQLLVLPPGTAGEAPKPIPLRQINRIRPGDRLLYRPVDVPSAFKKSARVSLVLAPGEASAKLAVFEPRPAGQPAEWSAPFRVAVAAIVFGPQGLDRKKVASLVNKDQELVAQLADYAAQTAQVENLIETLAAAEQGPSRNIEAALNGFAARSGAAIPKLDRNAPTDQQALTLLRALNPALSAYDPLAPQPATRMQQSAGLAASVAALFFGSNIGLAAGGAAMVQNFRTLLFPSTDFRSALAQPGGDGGLTLCARREAARSRTRLAYLWAHRIPDAGPPSIALSPAAHLPLGVKSSLPVQADAKLLARARAWKLVSKDNRSFPVPVNAGARPGSLEIDLTRANAPPGVYQLAAQWDWESFTLPGDLHLHALPDLKTAVVEPQSEDRLIHGSGPVAVTLAGADFEFVEKVAIGEHPVEFRLPAGRRAGPQQTLETTVDTNRLNAGAYHFLLYQPDGSVREVPFRVLPPSPAIRNVPLRANLGERRQKLFLRGTGLDRIERIESPAAEIELVPGRDPAGRELFIHLAEGAKKGDRIALALQVEGLHEPVPVPAAIEVAGPRPRIAAADASLPDDLGVALRPGELPAGSYASFSVRTENLETQPAVRLECATSDLTLEPVTLRPGEKRPAAKLETAGPDVLFLSLDPGAIGRPGCTLTALVETEQAGGSDPYTLGRVIRLPRIESFVLTDEKLGDSSYAGVLTGQDLEMIEKAGWDARNGLPVAGLPRPVAGQGQKQTLKIALPWPSPAPRAPVYIWLRGETEGRATRARY